MRILIYTSHLALFTLAIALNTVFADYLNCPCKVVKVSNGDTVHVQDQTKARHAIRLGGIDAPEKKQLYARKSKDNLSNLVAGKNVDVEYSRRDRYGRIIGKLIKDGQDINLMQLKQGCAWHYKYYQKDQSEIDRILYSSAEIDARKKTIGLWAYPAIPPWEFRSRN